MPEPSTHAVMPPTPDPETRLRALEARLAEAEAGRARAEAVLAETERLTGLGRWTWEVAEDRLTWSDELYRIYGIEDRRFERLADYLAILPEGHRAGFQSLIQRSMADGQPYFLVTTVLRADGTTRHVQVRGEVTMGPDGRPVRMGGTVQDLTTLHGLESELIESEARLRAIVEHTIEGIAIRDREGRFIMANSAIAAALGYTPETIVGRPDSEVFGPESLAAMRETDRQVLEKGVSLRYELPIQLPGGEQVVYVVAKHPYIGPTGEVAGIISLGTNISDRVEMDRLQREQIRQLKELDRLKSGFVGAVSHELRTPLTTIKGYTEFLIDGIGGELQPDQAVFVTEIERSTARLEALVDDLLDFARIDAGTFKLRPAETNLGDKAHEVAASFAPQLQAAGIQLAVTVPDRPLVAMADARRVGQVLINLVSNAIKFTPEGGTVEVRVVETGGRARFEVADTGCGIAPEDLSKLFRPFSRLDDGNSRNTNGTGLGLSIAKVIVEGHGGTIGVESAPGEGSIFWFVLPMKETTPQPR